MPTRLATLFSYAPRLRRSAAACLAVLCILLLPTTWLSVAAAQPNAAPTAQTPYDTLAELLENESTRQQLINELRRLAQENPSGGEPTSTGDKPAAPEHTPADPEKPAAEHPSLLSSLPGAAAASKLLSSLKPEPPPPPLSGSPPVDTGSATPAKPPEPADLPRQITSQAQVFLTDLAAGSSAAVQAIQNIAQGNTETLVSEHDWPAELSHLAIVAAVALTIFLMLRRLVTPWYRRMDSWVVRYVSRSNSSQRVARLYSRTAAMVGALLVDLAIILVAATAGYMVALLFTGERGDLATYERLFINTFLAVEIGRALIRFVFATRFHNLRLLPIQDDTARYWNNWLERIAIVAGYGVMLLIPIVGDILTPELARVINLVLMVAVYSYAVRVVWSNRHTVRNAIAERAAQQPSSIFGALQRVLAKGWHLLAIAYFTVLLVISQTDPLGAMAFMVFATLQTLLSVGLGVLASAFLSALLARPFRLPEDTRRKLPLLESRLNSYVPAAVRWAKLIILGVVLLFVLDAWRLFHVGNWLASESGGTVVATIVQVSIVILFAAVIWTIVASIIEHRLNLDDSTPDNSPSARERTLLSLFRNATLILIVTMTLLVVLSQIGIDIGPLIAGAGVVGLAIGFGAQKLVQDVINGIFIQLENGMNQNDVVEVGGVFGTVEKITIRSVGIRTLDGGYHMIPFSSVDKVANHMRDFSYHLGEYTIAYRESVDDAAYYLERAFDELMTDPVLAPEVLEDMVIAGVTSLNERGFTIRVMIKTKPGMQWAVQRGFNRLVKKHFNAAGIELPYPHTVVYFGQDKHGEAPPIRVRDVADADASVPGQKVMPAGHTRRPLTPPDHSRAADVLGNELATVVDEDGKVSSQPGTSAPRPTDDDPDDTRDPERRDAR